MRRSTSALTAGTLGAALMASVVSAQEYQSPAVGQGNSPAASAPATVATPAAAQSAAAAAAHAPGAGTPSNPIVGMAATRGARYLLRNGLDYLNYQEYERALKLLREAETRQKELGEMERLQLKQGIERAQRGLREAVGIRTPYALSSRSHRTGVFSVAQPETQIAVAKTQPPNGEVRTEPTSSRVTNREGDDQGQPIQLAGAEVPTGAPAATQAKPGADPVAASTAAGLPGPIPATADQPAPLPEIPKPLTSTAPANLTVAEQGPSAPNVASPVENTTTSPASADKSAAPPLDTGPPASPSEPSVAAPGPAPDSLAPPEATPAGQVLDRPAPAGPAPATPGPAPDAAAPSPLPSKDSGATSASNSAAPEPHPESPPARGPAAPVALEEPAGPGTKPAPAAAETPAPETPLTVQPTPPAETPAPTAQPTPSAGTTIPAGPANTPAPLGPTPPDAAASMPSDTDDLPPLPEDITAAAETNRSDPPKTAAKTAQTAKNEEAPNTAAAPSNLPVAPQGAARSDAEKGQTEGSPPAADDPSRSPTIGADAPPAAQESSAQPVLPPEPVLTPIAGPGTAATTSAASSEPAAISQASASKDVPSGNQEAASSSTPASPSTSVPAAPASPVQETASGAAPPQEPAAGAVSTAAPAQEPAPATVPTQETTPATASATVPAQQPAAQPLAPVETPQPRPGPPEANSFVPRYQNPSSTLDADQRRRIEEIARMQEEELNRRQTQSDPSSRVGTVQPPAPGAPESITDLRTQTQTQVDISRAPSPAEARPIRAIPVPEDWVPLARRDWSPQRKYWAAAATCHMPLYFQDAMLERYGHSVENYFGPLGRHMTYPVDDPTQTTQRNQIAQPFFSAGLFAWQIITWPYALVVDPPWEAQYDLGYWRPGDRIPTDLYYQPLTGTGPALRGRNY